MNLFTEFDSKLITPDEFIAVVEISRGSKTKYELDKKTGALRLDRILSTSSHYPANYGFIPCTLAEDNDPLDVLILMSESILPLVEVHCKPIGVFTMYDQGKADEKIIAVCLEDPMYKEFDDINELPNHIFQEIRYFFETYKALEGLDLSNNFVKQVQNKQAAKTIIKSCIDRFESWQKEKEDNEEVY